MSYNDFDSEFYESGWPRRAFGSWQSTADDGLSIGLGMSPSFGSRYTRIGDGPGGDLYDSYQSFPNNNPIYKNWSSVYSNFNKEYVRNAEDNKMSFVGVSIYTNGILAFGDSKSTLKDPLGNMYEQEGRNVKKIVCGKDYIIVMHGINQYHKNSKDGILYNLETLVEDYANENSYLETLFLVLGEINKCSENLGSQYGFIVASMDEKGYFLQECKILDGIISFKEKIYGENSCWSGHTYYIQITKRPRIQDVYNGFEEMKNNIRESYEYVEKFGRYNPVGYPFHFFLLTNDGISERIVEE